MPHEKDGIPEILNYNFEAEFYTQNKIVLRLSSINR